MPKGGQTTHTARSFSAATTTDDALKKLSTGCPVRMLTPHSGQLEAKRHHPTPSAQLLEGLLVSRFATGYESAEGLPVPVCERGA
jgi:hypothetical protein